MSIISTVRNIFRKKEEPSYTIYVGGTPEGQTRTTSGETISTPGSTGSPGIYRTYGGGGGGSTTSTIGGSTTTTTELAPRTQPGIKSIDVGTKTQERTGFVNVRRDTGKVFSSYGITPQQAQDIAQNSAQREQGRLREFQQRQEEQREQQFYYKSEAGFGFGREQKGIKYYQTDEQGNVIKRFTPEEVKQYGLTPTKVLQARTQEDLSTRERFGAEIQEFRQQAPDNFDTLTGLQNTGINLGLGVATTGLGLYDLGYGALTSPIETIKGIPGGIALAYQDVSSGKFARGLRQEPAYFTGYLASQIALAEGTGKLVSLPINKVLQKMVSPRAESIVSVSLEGLGKGKGGAILQFETESGRVGTIKQVSAFKESGKSYTLALGDISKVKYRTGTGEPYLADTKAFAGKIESLSKFGEFNKVLFNRGGIKATSLLKGEAIAGRGEVIISPREKFFRTNYGIIPSGTKAIQESALIFKTHIKPSTQLKFYSKGFSFNVGSGTLRGFGEVRTRFLFGATQPLKKGAMPSGYAGFSFEKIEPLKLDKGFKIVAPKKSFVVLSSGQIAKLQKVYSPTQTLNLLSIASQSTARTPSVNLKIITPSIKTKEVSTAFQYPRSQYTGTGLYERTGGGLAPSQIERIRLDIKSISPALSSLNQLTNQRALTRTRQQPVVKEIQQEISLSASKLLQTLRQQERLKTRQILITSRPRVNFPTPRIPIPKIPVLIPKLPKKALSLKSAGTYITSIKKKGRLVPVYETPSLEKAFTVGKSITGGSIYRSFSVKSRGGKPIRQGVPFGYRRSRARGGSNIFVELAKTSISQGGERRALSLGRKRKKKRGTLDMLY